MSNNRDDKFEGQDDSEYHFSDDEVSYEVESEAPKAAPIPSDRGSMVSRLSGSKRMLISGGVFLAIVFVVYRIVSPGSSTPSTDITAAPTVATQMPVTAQPPQVAAAPAAPVAPVVAVTPAPAAVPANQPVTPQVVVQQPTQAVAAAPQPPVASLPAVIPVQSALPASQSPAAAMGAYIEDKSAALSAASQQAMSQVLNTPQILMNLLSE